MRHGGGRVGTSLRGPPPFPPAQPPPCTARGYSEREDEKAGAQQAALDGEPLGGGQLAAVHLHPSEEQQGQERGQRQRRARTHHCRAGEKRRGVRPGPPSGSRRPAWQVRPWHAPPGWQPCSPTPHTAARPPEMSQPGRPAPAGPVQTGPPPGTQDTSALRGEDQEGWSTPTPTPISLSGVSRRPSYPSRPRVGPTDASGRGRGRGEWALLPVRMRQLPARTSFPHVLLLVPLGASRGALSRRGGSIASKSVWPPPKTPALTRHPGNCCR